MTESHLMEEFNGVVVARRCATAGALEEDVVSSGGITQMAKAFALYSVACRGTFAQLEPLSNE
ncbi:hypothetical protein HJC23_002449 [Cyclotella cryptica]|uniref:Uncharacterized protein n=1 Tax=Cyclotella cryptica TaxID=29204 RepID=A0ABD3PUV9_9STRA